jgi:hypothetical protein
MPASTDESEYLIQEKCQVTLDNLTVALQMWADLDHVTGIQYSVHSVCPI